MKKSLLISGLVSIVFLAGCGAPLTISNVSIPGSAKDAENTSVGKNIALRYISNLTIAEACSTQVKLLTDAKWTETDPMADKGTYLKTTYTDGKVYMVLVCSQTEVSATEKATKVTLTLMDNK